MVKFFNLSSSIQQINLNFLNNSSNLLLKCASLLWMLETVTAQGTQPPGGGCPQYSKDCDYDDLCEDYEKMGHKLIQAGFDIFNQTAFLNATDVEKQEFFDTTWKETSHRIYKKHKSDHCDNASSIMNVMFSNIVPIGLSLFLIGKYLKNTANSLSVHQIEADNDILETASLSM